MRLIGELDNPSHAEKFSAFLMTEGISVQTDAVGDVIEIWAKDEDQFEQAKSELDQFQADVDHSRYAQAIQQANSIAREKKSDDAGFKRRSSTLVPAVCSAVQR